MIRSPTRTRFSASVLKSQTSIFFGANIHNRSLQQPHSEWRVLSVLRDCGASDIRRAREAHAHALVNGVDGRDSVASRILSTYATRGSFQETKNLFFRMERGIPLPWNWMIRVLIMTGQYEFVLLFYLKMWFCGVLPDKYTFPFVIKACSRLHAIKFGNLVHKTICFLGLEKDLFIGSSLVKMYAESDLIQDARALFDKIPGRDSVLWNVMIEGHKRISETREAIGLFNDMRYSAEPNYVSFVSVLSICATERMLDFGIQLHGLVIRSGVDAETSVGNTLLYMYSKCCCWDDVNKLFGFLNTVELVTWNALISGFVHNGLMEEALSSFREMQSLGVPPDSITFTSLLPSFSDCAGLKQGKEIQAYITKNNINMDRCLTSAFINLYFRCRDVESATKVFCGTEAFDVAIFSAMISGFVLNGMYSDALNMFHSLIQRKIKLNATAIASLLPACSSLCSLRLGKEVHCYALKILDGENRYIGSALIDMYAKCGRLDLSHCIFKRTLEKDSVTWNSMISSLAQNAQPEEAISLFGQMWIDEITYDYASVSTALSACANITALHYGREIHAFMITCALGSDTFSESALIDMYAKCGHLHWARRVFDYMQEKNEVSWNSIIAAYGSHGLEDDAEYLFHAMKEAGFQPDHVTFLSMISACSHAGKVKKGFQYFEIMYKVHGILPHMEHYVSVVDLFGRAGMLYEALNFINDMPICPDIGIWGALLGACRIYHNFELAELASSHLFELDPTNSGYYVLMSNVSAETGCKEGVLKVRSLMKQKGLRKSPGCSWIDINAISQKFIAADDSHPNSVNIYTYLDLLYIELQEAGYKPNVEIVDRPEISSVEGYRF